jgi:ATP-dependent exoDNAse (exonuclease V) beta subunit
VSPAPGSIHVVSASAGSGKTHRLVNEIEAAITRGTDPVRPEAIVATTFTVKAAAELRERVRTRLLEKGHVEQAQRLGAARIGTVNSVCGQLVTEFAFDLGISPESRVLDEDEAKQAFAKALLGLASMAKDEDGRALAAGSDTAAALMELEERWPGLEWLKNVQAIAEKARENGLAPDEVRACAARSTEGLLAYFGPAAPGGELLERELERALAAFKPAPLDTTDVTAKVVELVERTLVRLRMHRLLSWRDWSDLAEKQPGVKSRAAFEPVREAARGHERHPAVRDEVRRCIAAAFELAAQALEAYERHKRDWGVLDFVDQEVLALRLLRQPEVQEMLREQVDLVLVDEFQDTSPLQLEIFLELAKLAPRSFWVGDQKQAIYGFRGTDPALMDAAIAAIQQAGEPGENLPYSWRSRAELVRLTSDVFAPAFAAQGIAPERVRLEPAPPIASSGDGLGAVVEGWRLDVHDRKKLPDAQALAVAVRELMADPGALVRDVLTNEARRVRPADVAVLCRSSANCARVTDALEAAGIPAVRPRTGLVDTLEARVALAALRLWVDPRQPLAAAELGRLLVDPADADAWLARVLEEPGKAYSAAPVVGRLRAARDRFPLGGPLVAFDAALEAVGARECCLRWGSEAQRLGNLDALRAAAHGYVATCEVEGIAATVAGLVAHLESLAGGWGEERTDEQATLSGADAVTVGTLHSAKGLEWPVTVLFELDSTWKPSAFGVHVESDRDTFDFEAPLAGRWIRYWPDPYASAAGPWGRPHPGKTAIHDRIAAGAEHEAVARREAREMLRLLYVGWTRARDRLVFAARPGKLVGGTLGLLQAAAGFTEPELQCAWGGREVRPRIRTVQPLVPPPATPAAGLGYDAAGPREHPAAFEVMSKVAGSGVVGPVEPLGAAPAVQQPVDWNALGNAAHAFFAADREGLEPAERLAIARRMLEGWSVQGSLAPAALVASADALRAWIARRWPEAAWQREWPLRLRREDGTELVGYADLVLVSGDAFVLVDHKCLGGTREQALAEAAGYAGQLGAYAAAIERTTGKRAAGCWLHLVAQGLVAGVEVGGA